MTSAVVYSYGCLASTVIACSLGDAAGRGIMTTLAVAFACTALITWACDAR